MARIDFHVHTPVSDDFLGDGSILDVLRSAKRSGTDVVVLTDHNALDGYLKVTSELEQFQPMLVLPGIEITCRGGSSGIHVIAVLDPQHLGQRPRWILNALGLGADDRHANGLSSLDVVGVCKVIHDRGGLAIAAHASSSKGILHEMRGLQLARALEQCSFDAFELSTVSQRRRGIEVLTRLDLMSSATVVQGTDSHRARPTPGLLRPEGPGDRATTLELAGEPSFDRLREALRNAAGDVQIEPPRPTPIELFRDGKDSSVVAVWRSHDRRAVTRAVAATASAGKGIVLVGVRRGGRGGRGVVLARTTPPVEELEQWIWEDVRPVPAVEIERHELGDRCYIAITVLQDLNPFVYSVGGDALVRKAGSIKSVRTSTPDHAEIFEALREAVSPELLKRLVDPRPDALREEELESLFPWRGYLTKAERSAILQKIAYRISKGSESGVLRAWAVTSSGEYRTAAGVLVRQLTRALTVSEARRGLRNRLEEISASRALRRRVLGAFGPALEALDPLGLAELAPGSDVLRRTCERLADAVSDEGLDAELRDLAIDEGRRTVELIGSLIAEEQVQVVVDAVVGEFGEDARDGIAVTIVQAATPVEVVRADDAASVAGREIAIVSSEGTDVLAVGSRLLAVHAPVRDLADLLRTHRAIARFKPAHVMQRDQLLDVLDHRRAVDLGDEDRAILFRSCVRLGLPAWWSVGENPDLDILSAALENLVLRSRVGTELAGLLRYLAVLPGDFSVLADAASQRSRAVAVQRMVRLHNLPWEQRLAELVMPRQNLATIAVDAVTYGGQVMTVNGVPLVEALRRNEVGRDAVTRQVAEACGRHLRDVASEAVFDVLLVGLRHGWQTVSAIRRCDEATYLPGQIREVAPTAET